MPRHENQGKLERGRAKVILVRELALGATTAAELGRRYGVTAVAIRAFEERHATEITEARDDLESEWVGLWIADKRNRIAELQQLVEDANSQMASEVATGGFSPIVGIPLAKLVTQIYRQVAEELGQLPKHTAEPPTTQPTVIYEYPGVDPSKLI